MFCVRNKMNKILNSKKVSPECRQKDLYDAILPVFVLSKILGLAPFRFDSSIRRFTPHCGPMNVFRFSLLIGVMWYVSTLIKQISTSINIGWLAIRFELYFGTAVTSIVLILAITNQKMLIQAIENIIYIDKEMKKIGIRITYVNAQRFSYFQIIGITSVFFSKLILQLFTSKDYYKFVYNVFNVVDYINTIMLFQYVNFLLLLRQRYLWLNREIKKMAKNYCSCKFDVINTNLDSIIQLSSYTSEKVNLMSPLLLIKHWGKLQAHLFFTAKLINRTYSVQILTTFCARFVMITAQLINVYKTIQDPKEGDANRFALMAIYLFLHGSKLFMVASISDNTADKAKYTGIYLHTIWDCSTAMKNEINFLSLQILHQNLNFTAAGFFVLNYSLIRSMVGAVTTYLIIIIQFDANR